MYWNRIQAAPLPCPRLRNSLDYLRNVTGTRFLEMEVQRRLMVLNQRVKYLENENNVLRQRLSDMITGQEDVQSYMRRNGITDMLKVNPESGMRTSSSTDSVPSMNGSINLLNLSSNNSSTLSLNNGTSPAPPIPPRSSVSSNNGQQSPDPIVGTRLEGLLLDELEDDFNPRAYEQTAKDQKCSSPVSSTGAPVTPPVLAPPPKAGRDKSRQNGKSSARAGMDEIFGSAANTATPRPKPQDPFGMGNFSIPVNGNSDSNSSDYHNLGLLDKRILEMKDGFSRGLSISTEDFSLESLDPLKN
ncbi:PTB domain-containing adapter protein ced-6-like [Planococcus citri]|uniref:PTB domain-containing adapter protein ced-6-like n=1 Tax=Planococcus citri TaxID=170843 RepID=UPI0031F98B3B